jgi:hypothetical protein
VHLLDEYTIHIFFKHFDCFDSFIKNIEGLILGDLVYVGKNGKIRKNYKRDKIYKFLFQNGSVLDDVLLVHIVIRLFKALQTKNFNSTIGNKNDIVYDTNNTMQKIIEYIVSDIVVFMDFWVFISNTKIDYTRLDLYSNIFYIINLVAMVKVGGVKCINIVADKSILNGRVYTINRVKCGLVIPKSI